LCFFLLDSETDVTSADPQQTSALIAAWTRGNEQALNQLIPLVYPQLRRIARLHLARRDHTLQSAALVNEAYLKLVRSSGIQCESRPHFFALCAVIIRRVLVDYSRQHHYAKRGGDAVRVPLDEALIGTRARGVDVAALDDALVFLARVDPRKARMVELRYFGGLSVTETAEVLQISPETVLRDWRMAKTWLFRELNKTSSDKSRS
jgi:RNA polymerase sigma factor (TIGR02999 family)